MNDLPLYWNNKDVRDLNRAKSYGDMAKIAVRITGRMIKVARPLYEVCGPISTGGFEVREKNVLVFRRAIDYLRGGPNLNVFDPLPFQEGMVRLIEEHRVRVQDSSAYDQDLLEQFYGPLFRTRRFEAGYFLPTWRTSRGSRWEWDFLTQLGIERREFPLAAYNEIVSSLG